MVYFILSGRAKVTLYGEEGREIVLSVLEEGEMFGEMSIIDDKPRSANVEVVRDLECLVLSRERFFRFSCKPSQGLYDVSCPPYSTP